MQECSAATDIKASAEKIWAILTDGAKYVEWDPGMIRLDGKIALGEKLVIVAKVSPKRAFKVTVTQFVPNQEMVWGSGMPLGLFKGERTFRLESGPDGKVHFSLREVFTGLLLPLFSKSLPDMNPIFADFAAALKTRAEQA